jgi:pimeloyl-ACP methyl ester carboxylesterase
LVALCSFDVIEAFNERNALARTILERMLPSLVRQQFDATPSARSVFFRLNEDLLPTIRSRTKMLPKLREFRRQTRIIFGDAGPYLNKGVAQRFHELFPVSDLFLVPGGRHFVQMDEPAQVAHLILATPRTIK